MDMFSLEVPLSVLMLKVLVFGLVALLGLQLKDAAQLGKDLHADRTQSDRLYKILLRRKKTLTFYIFCSIIFSILAIEATVQVTGRRDAFPTLLPFHLVFAFIFFALFVTLLVLNGHRHPRQHRKIAIMFIVFGMVALISGLYMLVKM
ncbi:MAG: hypothetical protein JWM39_330 [Parcubacteria group bacterium]|nr:hypothetical protein [Parcubacteria group bacterium]